MLDDLFARPMQAVWLAAGLTVAVALVAVARAAVRAIWPPRRRPSALARTVDDLPDEHAGPKGIGSF